MAAPLTATYEGVLFGTATPFTATFSYDPADLHQDSFDPTLFDADGHTQSAVFNAPGMSLAFDSSDYFYQRISDGLIPAYEFGIRSLSGQFLYLKLTGTLEEGDYYVPSPADPSLGDTVILDPRSVKISIVPVSPVPLPGTLALFAGALSVLGMAGRKRTRRQATSAISD